VSYITHGMANKALHEMSLFYYDLQQLHKKHGLDLESDLGRRNVILSTAQEKFFGRAISEAGHQVETDGRTGQSDIVVILDDGSRRELECKLTTRNSAGGIVFQTDHATLEKKGELDYLYVIADADFQSFAVLHFERLTTEDFRYPAAGSRGKVSMLKHSCYDRCRILFGDYRRVNDRHIRAIEEQLAGNIRPKKRAQLESRLEYWRADPGHFEVSLNIVA